MPRENSSTITVEDRAIASLKTLITNLNLQSSQLTNRISELTDAARNQIKIRNRLSAIHALRSKKLAEQSLAQKLDYLAQLERVYDNIEQAVDQVAIIQALKDSTRVLHSIHSQVGDVETVETIMEELQTEMLKSDDISNAINEAGQGASAIDDEAIDEELELLLHQSSKDNDEKQVQHLKEKLASITPLKESGTAKEPKDVINAPVPIPSILVSPDRENLSATEDPDLTA